MKSDAQIQNDVMDQLKWEPFLRSSEIRVAVKNGIVSLSGQVDSYSKKQIAERAAKKVAGVKAIAEEIKVGISPMHAKSDFEIAESVVNTLKLRTMIPDEKIKVSVEQGIVKLEGEVEWEFQRTQAKMAIEDIICNR